LTIKTLFLPKPSPPYFEEVRIVFKSTLGQRLHEIQKSITALHVEIQTHFDGLRLLEISSRSPDPIGNRLSAFNLNISLEGHLFPVESVYQSAKCFESAGPNLSLRTMSPPDAKLFYRGKKVGHLSHFFFENENWPLVSYPNFYDYLYIRALIESKLHSLTSPYSGFTDSAYVTPKLNPTEPKIANCQARSMAIFQGLRQTYAPLETLDIVKGFALEKERSSSQFHLPFFE